MQKEKLFRLMGLVVVLVLAISCSFGPSTTTTPPTSAPPQILPTNPPPPTAVPPTAALPTAIPPTNPPPPPPTPEGPKIVDDDFSSDTGRFKCNECKVQDGVLFMGPNPSAGSYDAYPALCNDCGEAKNYKMSVDAWYVEGPSDRGFGLILRENNGSFIDLEVTTWQVYGVWTFGSLYPIDSQGWGHISPGWIKGGLKPGRAVNHVEVTVESGVGKSILTILINGGSKRVFDLPSGSGNVGLLVGMHSLGAAFDNFHFEPLP